MKYLSSTTADDSLLLATPEKSGEPGERDEGTLDPENDLPPVPEYHVEEEVIQKFQEPVTVAGNGTIHEDLYNIDNQDMDTENVPILPRPKKEKSSAKKLVKEMQLCKNLLGEMECHEHAWPFLVPVNTKQFPQYKKVIKAPMDLSTIKKKLLDTSYKCRDDFAADVRLMFSNCEVFNEDDSPVGRAGHNMRQFFDLKWTQM